MHDPLERFRTAHAQRLEYGECEPERLEIITDMADELLISTERLELDTKGDEKRTRVYTTDPYTIARNFSYMESGLSSGWVWPLTETRVAIQYARHMHPTRETYKIELNHTIHQQDIAPPPLRKIYTIEYVGKNRESKPSATMGSINLDILDESSAAWDSRELSIYDCEQLFNELGHIYNLQQIQARENQRLDALFRDNA